MAAFQLILLALACFPPEVARETDDDAFVPSAPPLIWAGAPGVSFAILPRGDTDHAGRLALAAFYAAGGGSLNLTAHPRRLPPHSVMAVWRDGDCARCWFVRPGGVVAAAHVGPAGRVEVEWGPDAPGVPPPGCEGSPPAAPAAIAI